ncbi:MAG: hypothetical protein QY314_03695 [Candidatus Dojkabacteria bacterium]|nr:MAG: hypothetical protein QY314_03695 [Candidatus Dojkabacteria bacterium]
MANYKVPKTPSGEIDGSQVIIDMLKIAIREFRKANREIDRRYPQLAKKSHH